MHFRLDYLNDDGSKAEAVPDPVLADDFQSRHATTARQAAIHYAAEAGRAVLLSRVGKDGLVKPTLVIEPSGTCKPPAGMKSEHDAEARVCFCPACRAARTAERARFE